MANGRWVQKYPNNANDAVKEACPPDIPNCGLRVLRLKHPGLSPEVRGTHLRRVIPAAPTAGLVLRVVPAAVQAVAHGAGVVPGVDMLELRPGGGRAPERSEIGVWRRQEVVCRRRCWGNGSAGHGANRRENRREWTGVVSHDWDDGRAGHSCGGGDDGCDNVCRCRR
jgi:hypothetical protein